MIRAILAGSKTQTRRVVKDTGLYAIDAAIHGAETAARELQALASRCPYGKPGDRLWVRETCRADASQTGPFGVTYMADAAFRPIGSGQHQKWADLHTYGGVFGKQVPSIHMPRWASRITLEVTGIRVERVASISESDAIAEGIDVTDGEQPSVTFARLWDSINGQRAPWQSNPWVWVVAFRLASS